jgi:hypothetical protein
VSSGALSASRQNNVYELACYPGCFTPYNGTRRADTAVVVGFGDATIERLFFKRDMKHAIAYAKSQTPVLVVDQFPFTQLCVDAIEALLSSE